MKDILKNLDKNDLIKIFLIFIITGIEVWIELKMPDFMAEITRLVQTKGSLMINIIYNGIGMLICAMGSLILAIIIGYIVANMSAAYSMKLRQKLFNKIANFSLEEIKKFKTSSLITRTTNDVTQIEMLVGMGIHLFIRAILMAIWAITKILNKSWQWSSITSLAVIILLITIGIIITKALPRFKLIQKLIDKTNGTIRENLTGIRVVKAFNAEKYHEEKFAKINNNLTDLHLLNQKLFSLMSPIMHLVMNFLFLAIYFIGAILIDKALLTNKIALFGDMVVFSSYSMQVIISFLMLAIIFMMVPRAQVSMERIKEVLDTKNTIKDGFIKNSKEVGTVEFKNVSFKYPDAEECLLKNISFKVLPGQTVAFIGSTGSGKSTLINLIPRFYDVTQGEVLVDNINVKDYKMNYLYNKLGYVSQNAVIFNGSVKFNIAFGDNNKRKSSKLIKKSLEIAQAKEFVMKMNKKENTLLASRGTNISGGQKQRISIARAIAREPEIYIFDDSFSALDYKTDIILRKELKKYTKNATCLIVSQRIGTIMNADKIIVLDEGKCVGKGTHKELLKNCEVYKQIALSQLSEKELVNEKEI